MPGIHHGQPMMVKVQFIPDSICFLGVTRTGMHCNLFLSLFHPAWGCTLVGNQDLDMLSRLQTLESIVLAITTHPLQQQGLFPCGRMPLKVCRDWNAGSIVWHIVTTSTHGEYVVTQPQLLPAVTIHEACSQTSTLSLSENHM